MSKIAWEDDNAIGLADMPQVDIDSIDALRYRWLRKQYADGHHTYIAEMMYFESQLDEYIDKHMKEAHGSC